MGYAPQTPFSDGLKATVEWYAAQPRLVGAAAPPGPARQAAARSQASASDPLAGHRRGRHARPRPDRPAGGPGRGVHRPRPGRPRHHRRRGGRRGGRPSSSPTSSSTAPPGPPSTPPRRTRTRPCAINGDGAANLAAACAERRRPARPPLDRLRLRRPRHRPVRRGRADRPAQRLRPHQAGGRAGGARRPAGRRATSSAPPGCTARTARTSSRRCSGWPGTAPPPAWSTTSTASPPGRPTSPPQIYALVDARPPRRASTTRPAPARRPGSASPRKSSAVPGSGQGQDPKPSRCPNGPRLTPRPSAPPTTRRRRRPGLQRPRPRRLARGGHRADRRLEGRPAPRLPGDARGRGRAELSLAALGAGQPGRRRSADRLSDGSRRARAAVGGTPPRRRTSEVADRC